MFDTLSERLQAALSDVRSRGKLTEDDIGKAMRAIRLALLEADVNFQVVKSFTAQVKERALGEDVAQSLTPGQMVTKIVSDELTELMGGAARDIAMSPSKPTVILMAGLQGSGKTTTVGKLAYLLRQDGFNPLVVAADTYRAAAIEQMEVWAERAGVPCFSGQPGGDPAAVVFDGIQLAARRGNAVVLVDTAGRLQTQSNLLNELAKVGRVAAKALPGAPHESLLVLDGNLGQSNLAQAKGFNKALEISGLVLTKMDGTAKGGAVVAIESELDVPTKLIGVGEGPADMAPFDVARFAHSLLGDGVPAA